MDTEKDVGATGRGMSRKEFLAAGATAGAGAALSGLVARNAMAVPSRGRSNAGKGEGGYGELSPKKAENDSGTYLAVPAGFSYAIFGVEGSEMSDGNLTPKGHDGMAAFQLPNGNVRLIRNHEDRDNPLNSTVKGDPSTAYDSKGGGGTTSLEVRPGGDRELVRDFQSLNGTIVNCAGGPTPWDTWMTCEETTAGQTQGWNKDHGYIYEVPVSATNEVQATPHKAMGRFVHEAAAVDPKTGYVYMTEDRGTAGLYRFIPSGSGDSDSGEHGEHHNGHRDEHDGHRGRQNGHQDHEREDSDSPEDSPLSAGRVQMLKIKGRANYNTTSGQRVDKPLPVEWVDIEDPDSAEAETNPLAVFQQGQDKGGAIFSRLEGCWYGDGSIFFHATDGGDAELGQVWEYRPRGRSGGQLILLFESKSPEMLDAPDNVTVSPRGGLAICEDGDNGNYVRGLTEDGKIFDLVHNVTNDREFAGATFSPDGETLFFNIQGDLSVGGPGNKGMTFAIWGPWEDGAL